MMNPGYNSIWSGKQQTIVKLYNVVFEPFLSGIIYILVVEYILHLKQFTSPCTNMYQVYYKLKVQTPTSTTEKR